MSTPSPVPGAKAQAVWVGRRQTAMTIERVGRPVAEVFPAFRSTAPPLDYLPAGTNRGKLFVASAFLSGGVPSLVARRHVMD